MAKKTSNFIKLAIVVYVASFLFSFANVSVWYAVGGCKVAEPIRTLISARRVCNWSSQNSNGIWVKSSLANDRFELKEDVLSEANLLFGVVMFLVILLKVPNKNLF